MQRCLRIFLFTAYGLKFAQAEFNGTVASFGQPFQIAGGNARTEVTVSNEFTIDAYSATPHSIKVTRNQPSTTAEYVTTSDTSSTALSGPWVALNKYSYQIQVDDGQSAVDDMIVKLEARFDPAQLKSEEINVSNVYLGVYNATRAGWVIDTERANIQVHENHARIIGLNAPDGEYMLLGRSTLDLQNFFIQFSSASGGVTNWTINASPSDSGTQPPLQVGVWVDGLRIQVRSPEQLTVRADIQAAPVQGIPAGYAVISPWSHNITHDETGTSCEARVQLPYSSSWLSSQKLLPSQIVIGSRQGPSEDFTIHPVTLTSNSGFLMTEPVAAFAGEYVLMGSHSLNPAVHQEQEASTCNCPSSASVSSSSTPSVDDASSGCQPLSSGTNGTSPSDENGGSGYPTVGSGPSDSNNTTQSQSMPGTNQSLPFGDSSIPGQDAPVNSTSYPDSATDVPAVTSGDNSTSDQPCSSSDLPADSGANSDSPSSTNGTVPTSSNCTVPGTQGPETSPHDLTIPVPGGDNNGPTNSSSDFPGVNSGSPEVSSGNSDQGQASTTPGSSYTPENDTPASSNCTDSGTQSPETPSNDSTTSVPGAGFNGPTNASSNDSGLSSESPSVSSGNGQATQSSPTPSADSNGPTNLTPDVPAPSSDSPAVSSGNTSPDSSTESPPLNDDQHDSPTVSSSAYPTSSSGPGRSPEVTLESPNGNNPDISSNTPNRPTDNSTPTSGDSPYVPTSARGSTTQSPLSPLPQPSTQSEPSTPPCNETSVQSGGPVVNNSEWSTSQSYNNASKPDQTSDVPSAFQDQSNSPGNSQMSPPSPSNNTINEVPDNASGPFDANSTDVYSPTNTTTYNTTTADNCTDLGASNSSTNSLSNLTNTYNLSNSTQSDNSSLPESGGNVTTLYGNSTDCSENSTDNHPSNNPISSHGNSTDVNSTASSGLINSTNSDSSNNNTVPTDSPQSQNPETDCKECKAGKKGESPAHSVTTFTSSSHSASSSSNQSNTTVTALNSTTPCQNATSENTSPVPVNGTSESLGVQAQPSSLNVTSSVPADAHKSNEEPCSECEKTHPHTIIKSTTTSSSSKSSSSSSSSFYSSTSDSTPLSGSGTDNHDSSREHSPPTKATDSPDSKSDDTKLEEDTPSYSPKPLTHPAAYRLRKRRSPKFTS